MGAPKGLIAIVLFIFSTAAEGGQEVKYCEREMSQAAAKYKVPLGILFAVGLAETGIDGRLHAYALNLEGNTVYSLNKTQAIERFNAAKAAGMKLIDVGCMQLNYYFHGERFAVGVLSFRNSPSQNAELLAVQAPNPLSTRRSRTLHT